MSFAGAQNGLMGGNVIGIELPLKLRVLRKNRRRKSQDLVRRGLRNRPVRRLLQKFVQRYIQAKRLRW